MAQLYPRSPSVPAGESLTFHVSSAQPFRIDFYRYGVTLEFKQSTDLMAGMVGAEGPQDEDWGWSGYEVAIPDDWTSGVYIALAVEEPGAPEMADPQDPSSESAKTLFVVINASPDERAPILYKVPVFTYQAYNELANPPGSLHTGNMHKVTMRRPGGGIGGLPWDRDATDFYDPSSPRQVFAHWNAPFIRWLEANGYQVDYCSDLDLHGDPTDLLSSYRLVISVGHDEYWSAEQRDTLEAFVASGGNLAFFSANTCWWRVHLTDDDTAFTCDKQPIDDPNDQWFQGESARPENALTGVSYRNAGGDWAGARPAVGYTVQYADHWVYEGVERAGGGAIREGDVFGEDEALVGYECDGAAIAAETDPDDRMVAALSDGTPSDFLILGFGMLPPDWIGDRLAGNASAATMGLYTGTGIVFTAATTDWARLLSLPAVDRITRNVLDRLATHSVRILGLSDACGSSPAVEGATIDFSADLSGLPSLDDLTWRWAASDGDWEVDDQPIFRLTLPSPPHALTVTLSIGGPENMKAFGTLTFMPMTTAEYEQAQISCALEQMVTVETRSHLSREGGRDRGRLSAGPLWHPTRGSRLRPYSRAELRRMAAHAKAIAVLADRLESCAPDSQGPGRRLA